MLVQLIQYSIQSVTGMWTNHIFLGDAKMLQSGTPRPEIFKKLMYIQAFKYQGILHSRYIHVRKKNIVTTQVWENASSTAFIGVLFLLQ